MKFRCDFRGIIKKFNLSLYDIDLTRLIISKVNVNYFTVFFFLHFDLDLMNISLALVYVECVFSISFRFGARWLSLAIKSIHSFFREHTHFKLKLITIIWTFFVSFRIAFFFSFLFDIIFVVNQFSVFANRKKTQFFLLLMSWMLCSLSEFSHWIKPFDWVTSYTLNRELMLMEKSHERVFNIRPYCWVCW